MLVGLSVCLLFLLESHCSLIAVVEDGNDNLSCEVYTSAMCVLMMLSGASGEGTNFHFSH